MGVKYSPRFDATSPTCTQRETSGCRVMICWTVSNSPWMSPRAPISMDGTAGRGAIGWMDSASRARRRRWHEQIGLVPDEVVFAVHGELVILAHEDRADGASLLAVATEDAAGFVNLVHRRIARAGLDVPGVLRRFEVDRVGRTRNRTQPAGHALLQVVFVPH